MVPFLSEGHTVRPSVRPSVGSSISHSATQPLSQSVSFGSIQINESWEILFAFLHVFSHVHLGQYQGAQGGHTKAAGVPCCSAAGHTAARLLSDSADPFAFEAFPIDPTRGSFFVCAFPRAGRRVFLRKIFGFT